MLFCRVLPMFFHKPRHGTSRHVCNASQASGGAEESRAKSDHRLSERISFGRSRSTSSANLPENLPDVEGVAQNEDDEAKWEKRATMMVMGGQLSKSGSVTPSYDGSDSVADRPRSRSRRRSVSDAGGDANIQEAIRLHESGQLEESTKMFGKLADPKGANNALSQVLYGLALRYVEINHVPILLWYWKTHQRHRPLRHASFTIQ